MSATIALSYSKFIFNFHISNLAINIKLNFTLKLIKIRLPIEKLLGKIQTLNNPLPFVPSIDHTHSAMTTSDKKRSILDNK